MVSCPARRSPAAGRALTEEGVYLADAALDGQGGLLASQALSAPQTRSVGLSWGL
jgi:hypothetical protein